MSTTTQPAVDSDAVQSAPLVEFLNTLPSPLTTTLVALSPSIARLRHALQILTWKAPWEECWLFLASWWAVCLVPEFGLRYVLPVAVFLVFFRLRSKPQAQATTPPVTEDTLQRAIADITTIHALLPSRPTFTEPSAIPPPTVLLRSIAVLYIPYLALTHLVRIRIIIALSGTVIFTWRARWTSVLRGALWRSAHIRWASLSDAQLASVSASAQAPQGTSMRFLFTVYENQRWWMGLDWTAALLPGERPSWCSASQQPAAPPSAFALPAATTVYTLAPDGKHRLKRTAKWRWEESEWRVVVHTEGSGTSRVERTLPSAKEESAAAASASRLLKAAGKMRAPSVDVTEKKGGDKDHDSHKTDVDGGDHAGAVDGHAHGSDEGDEDEEPLTDPDGWVYADNKWEGASNKGGMGKYTRYRRWTRIAVLTEIVEVVEPGELGIRRDEPVPDVHNPEPSPAPLSISTPAQPGPHADGVSAKAEMSSLETQSPTTSEGPRSSVDEEGSRLTQRLKAAVKSATGHS
ncbi:integral peroxisomal membrane peroxin-domain-containing protein [Cerioporus squamosus]|nr:integral peroxisomal membrane peroxin-domain-containing protein [Cerioporus squamosus]